MCSDGQTQVFDLAACPVVPTPTAVEIVPAPVVAPKVEVKTYICDDGVTNVFDLAACPVVIPEPIVMLKAAEIARPNLNMCGTSNVAIFSIPADAAPKQVTRLGTMPEFGNSHGLTPSAFFEKLQARYADNETDRKYLDYLFTSMGYENGFADAQPYMFSEDVLPVGTSGLLGLGKQHHFEYSVLPSQQEDREAFRILSANGSVVHFMKTCGNYFYGCEK